MAIQFVLGATGTGKTIHILDEMYAQQANELGRSTLFIVPEQYTLKAQEEYLYHTKANGLMKLEVVSFNRLVNRYKDLLGIAEKTLMDDISFSMIIRKLIQQYRNEFTWISRNSKQQTFYDEICKIIKECYQYQISPEQLGKLSQSVSDQLLQDKMNDLSRLLSYFIDYQKENYILAEEASRKLSQVLTEQPILKDTPIYIDGFYGFTPLQYHLIESIIISSPKVTICVTVPSDEALGDLKDETDLFYESKKIISTIRNLACDHNIEEYEPIIMDLVLRKQSPSLQHVSDQLFRYPVRPYAGDDCSVRCVESVSIKDEVEAVALKIHQLIYERNYRFKDIVVLTSDLESYKDDIKIIFDEYQFNFFLDHKENVIQHPTIQFVLSALLVHQYNFRYEHVFYHLKSIFYSETEDIEKIENYCLKYGIKGFNRWKNTWGILEEEKLLHMSALMTFHENMNTSKTIKEKIRSVYQLLEAVGVETTCLSIAQSLYKENKSQEAKAYEQVYSLVLSMFDQIVMLIGDEIIERNDFTVLIESGLELIKLGQTPVNVDQLLVGQINRSRFKEAKALFVLGMNEGKIPLITSSGSLLTDQERTSLQDLGVTFAPTQEYSLFKEQITIYMGLTRCTRLLHLSFARQGNEEVMRPAALFLSILKMFPEMKLENATEYIMRNESITRIVPMYKKMVRLATVEETFKGNFLNDHGREDSLNLLYNLCKQVYNYERNHYVLNPSVFFDGLNYSNEAVMIQQLPAGEYDLSVSEVETYNTCPYRYFLEHRLKINDRQEYIVSLPDIGNLFHACMELYLKKCMIRHLDIGSINTTLRNQLIDETVQELIATENYKIFLSTNQNKYLILKLTRILKRAIWGIEQHVSRHILRPKDLEYKFNGKSLLIEPLKIFEAEDSQLYLKGVVDRIDEYETDADLLFSIIDYKSSHSDIDYNLVKKGIQLQLYVYLDVIKSIKEHGSSKTVVPVGLYYYHIQDPYLKVEEDELLAGTTDTESISEQKDNTINDSDDDIHEALHDQFATERIKMLSPKGFALYQEHLTALLSETNMALSDVDKEILRKAIVTSKTGSLTDEEIETTLFYVKSLISQVGEHIYKGEIPIRPYRYGQSTSCDYCKFNAICRFDPTNKNEVFERVDKKSRDEVISQMKGDCNGRSH